MKRYMILGAAFFALTGCCGTSIVYERRIICDPPLIMVPPPITVPAPVLHGPGPKMLPPQTVEPPVVFMRTVVALKQ